MTGEGVLRILDVLREHGVEAWVDGGWGVDALLGHQTRPHEDLDLVVALEDLDLITSALEPFGYSIQEDHLPVRFVMRDSGGSQLDFHTVSFDVAGGGVQPQPGGGSFRYPPEGFVRGEIAGREVACISAGVQILCHLGYEPSSKDAHDVSLLCRHFGLALPSAYQQHDHGTERNRLEIREDDLRGERIASFLREHLDDMHEITPAESVHALDLEALRSPDITFWSAWEGDELLGCGALKELDSKSGEVKSMRTAAAHRGSGVGSKILEHIIKETERRGYDRLNLETGAMTEFAPARALYLRYGFEYRGPFGDYKDDPNSVFMTRKF